MPNSHRASAFATLPYLLPWTVASALSPVVNTEQLLLLLAIGCCVAMAASIDARCGRLPNYLTLPAILLSIPLGFWLYGSQAFLGVAIAAGPLFLIALFGEIGMGDVKLSIALGAILGPQGAYMMLLLTTISILSVGLIERRRLIVGGPYLALSTAACLPFFSHSNLQF